MPISQERFEQYKRMKVGQGVDMARFEAYKALKAAQEPKVEQPKSVTEQVFTPLSETAALTGAGLMASRLAPTAAKLGMRGAGALAVPVMGLVGGGLELAKMTGEAIESSPNAPKTSMEALSRLGSGAWQGVSGEIIGQGVGKALGAMVPSRKLAAQGMRVMTGVPEREGLAVLKDPSILSRAKSVEQAGKEYGESTLGLKGGAEGARQAFGKSHLTADAAADKFDEILPKIKDETLDLQTAFSLRQTTMDKLSDLPYNEKSMKRLLGQNVDTLDAYIEARLPEWSGARQAFRESKIAEEFGSWLPLNKNLSPNVLRTTAAIAATGKGVMEGNPIMSLALPAISPKVWGYGIRAGGAVAPAVKAGAEVGAKATGYAISSTEELLRKKYQEQK